MARAADPPVPERAYQEIKARIQAGRFRLRQRLDASAIASSLGVSTTPVREALLRLVAERLVSFKQSHGFSVAMWSESGLRDLYRWRGEIAVLALEDGGLAHQNEPVDQSDYPRRATALLQGLQQGAHHELVLAAANADDRLHIARVAELALWPDAEADLKLLAGAITSGRISDIRHVLEAYHAKRMGAAKSIRDCAALLGLPSNGG